TLERVAEPVAPGKLDEALDERLEHGPVHVDALYRAAGLARVEVGAVDQVLYRRLQRRVGPHVRRVLAAELEAGDDEAPGRGALHRMAAADRAGEGDEADAGVGDDARRRLVIDVEELEHAIRQAGGCESLAVALGDEGRMLRHLQDHRVAGEERRHDGVHRGEPGVVPRREDQPHAERLAPDEALEARFFFNRKISESLFGDTAHVLDALMKAAADLAGALRDRAADRAEPRRDPRRLS